MTPAASQLHAATREDRQRLTETAFASEWRAGGVSKIDYINHLRVIAMLQESCNRMLVRSASSNTDLTAVATDSSRVAEIIGADLDSFRRDLVPAVVPVLELAMTLGQKITSDGAMVPISPLGHAFALAAVHEAKPPPQLSETLGVSAQRGGAYIALPDPDFGRYPEINHPETLDAVCEAAKSLLRGLVPIYDALGSVTENDALGFHSSALNPLSGSHPVTQDVSELRAALAATDRCFREHPYLGKRYGAYGRRFTDADGAWMAYLASVDAPTRRKRIDWLARLLSARGMPTEVVRYHLESVVLELVRANPDDAAKYQSLTQEAERLDAAITACIPRSIQTKLVDQFAEEAAGQRSDEYAQDLGTVIVNAVVDEAHGIKKALPSVLTWMMDEQRFSTAWIQAVYALVQNARAAVIPHGAD